MLKSFVEVLTEELAVGSQGDPILILFEASVKHLGDIWEASTVGLPP